jgi:hypothetical protein
MLTRQHVDQRLRDLKAREQAGELPEWLSQVLKRGVKVAYRAEAKQRKAARRRVQSARERGEIQRPGQSECCGMLVRVEGHHPDHNRSLEIQWLCKQCHIEADRGVEMGQRYTKSLVYKEPPQVRAKRLNAAYGEMTTSVLSTSELEAVKARLHGGKSIEELTFWLVVAGLEILPERSLAAEGVAA